MADKALTVKILVDSEDAQRGVDQVARKTEGLGAAFQTAAAFAATWLAGKALGAVKEFVGSSLEAYSELEQATGAIESVFGEWADVIEEESKRAAESVGLSESAYKNLASNLGGMLQNLGYDTEAAAAKTIELIETGSDLAATYGGEVADAVGAISSLMRGERDPIERYAVSIKQADVNARAMALGLDMSTTEAQKNAEAIAALDLLTQQAARTEGQFSREAQTRAGRLQRINAELENQKALLGEQLVPLEMVWTEIQKDALPIIGDLALVVGELTGALTEGEAALLRFEQAEGRAVETAGDFLAAFEEDLTDSPLHRGLRDFILTPFGVPGLIEQMTQAIEVSGLTLEELDRLAGSVQGLGDAGSLTVDEVRALSEEIEEQRQRILSAREAADADRVQLQKFADTQTEVATATGAATEEIEDQNEALRAQLSDLSALVDPAFSYIQAQQDLAAAQEAYNAAVEEFGENSPEAIAAAEDIAAANLKANEAVVAIGEQGVPAAIEALRTLGVPDAVIEGFRNDRDRIEEIFRNLVLRVGVSAPTLYPTAPASGGVGWEKESRTYYARGGIARATQGGQEAVVAEAGADEGVIPLNSHGARFMAHTLIEALSMIGVGSGPSGGSVVELNISADRSQPIDGWQIIEALQTIERQSGPLPIRVRAQ